MAFNFSQIIIMEITEAKPIGNCGKYLVRILITGEQWQWQRIKGKLKFKLLISSSIFKAKQIYHGNKTNDTG